MKMRSDSGLRSMPSAAHDDRGSLVSMHEYPSRIMVANRAAGPVCARFSGEACRST